MPNFTQASITSTSDEPRYCHKGHLKDAGNTYINSKGERVCKTCMYASQKRWRTNNPPSEEERKRMAGYRKAWKARNPNAQRIYRLRKKEQGQQP